MRVATAGERDVLQGPYREGIADWFRRPQPDTSPTADPHKIADLLRLEVRQQVVVRLDAQLLAIGKMNVPLAERRQLNASEVGERVGVFGDRSRPMDRLLVEDDIYAAMQGDRQKDRDNT